MSKKQPKETSAERQAREGYEWSAPFLRPDGLVWLHTGGGNWEAREQSDELARAQLWTLRMFSWALRSYSTRLEHFLETRTENG